MLKAQNKSILKRLANSVGMLPTEDKPRSTNDSKKVPERLPEEILLGSNENLSGKSSANDSPNASDKASSSVSNIDGWIGQAKEVEE